MSTRNFKYPLDEPLTNPEDCPISALLLHWYQNESLPSCVPMVRWLKVWSLKKEVPLALWTALRRAIRKELIHGAQGWDDEDWYLVWCGPFFRRGSKINQKIFDHFIEQARKSNALEDLLKVCAIGEHLGYDSSKLPVLISLIDEIELKADTFESGLELHHFGRKKTGLRLMQEYGTFEDWDSVVHYEDQKIRQCALKRMVALAHESGDKMELIRVSHIDISARKKVWVRSKSDRNVSLLFSFLDYTWTFGSRYWFNRFKETVAIVESEEDFKLLDERVVAWIRWKRCEDDTVWDRIFKILKTKYTS